MLQVLLLELLPGLTKHLNCVQGKVYFFLGELPVLTQSVQADDELLLSGLKWCVFELLPRLGLSLEVLAVFLFFDLELSLVRFPLGLLELLFSDLLGDDGVVVKSGLESLLEQARLVLQLDGHVRSQLRHLIVMDAALPYNLWHHEVAWPALLRNYQLLFSLLVIALLRLPQKLEGDALFLEQGLADHEFKTFRGIDELDLVLGSLDDVLIAVAGLRQTRRYAPDRLVDLANIDRRRPRELGQVVGQVLELVLEVVGALNSLVELSDFLGVGLLSGHLLSHALGGMNLVLLVSLFDGLNLLFLLKFPFVFLLDSVLLEQPLGKKVDGVLGLLLVDG